MVDNERQPRDRRPTLADVAAAAGVSVALVSIVMRDVPGASDTTRERVRRVAADLGYRPDQRARSLRRQRSRLLGVTFEVEQAFHGDLVEGLYGAADLAGYDLVLSAVAPSRPESRAVEAILDDRCEALIMVGPRSSARFIAGIAARLPVVAIARNVRANAVDCVRIDDQAGMRSAVDHLVELGHRDLAYVDGGSAAGAADRLRAFAAAAAAHRLGRRAKVLAGGAVEEDGVAATRQLLQNWPEVTAIIAFNDRCALGVLDTLLRAGVSVPQEISVVGYDDSRLSRLSYINLTTVGQHPEQLADAAVRRAVDRLENRPSRPRDLIVKPELLVRATTGPPVSGQPRKQ